MAIDACGTRSLTSSGSGVAGEDEELCGRDIVDFALAGDSGGGGCGEGVG